MNLELQRIKDNPKRAGWIIVALVGLTASFILQQVNILARLSFEVDPYTDFITRKVVRVIVNDLCMLLLIHAWFDDKAITRLAWKIQLIDTLILLPIYLTLKLTIEGDSELSSPLLSQLHRLIVNPTLMILLIPAVYFQRLMKQK